ncbi:MAG: hypothetical protein JW969_08120 [Spirochaetales bacterium]|nr:hypothetical protein [Spirochaetales bacterium]
MQNIGNFDNNLVSSGRYLLKINVKIKDIFDYWNKCGMIANFGSSYLAMNCPNNRNIANSISYVLNELLENAVKYSCSPDNIIEIYLAKTNNHIIMDVVNFINKKMYEPLNNALVNLQDSEKANTMYFKRLTTAAARNMDSGMGLLSIINFFQGEISARFRELPENDLYETEIQVKMNIEDL